MTIAAFFPQLTGNSCIARAMLRHGFHSAAALYNLLLAYYECIDSARYSTIKQQQMDKEAILLLTSSCTFCSPSAAIHVLLSTFNLAAINILHFTSSGAKNYILHFISSCYISSDDSHLAALSNNN